MRERNQFKIKMGIFQLVLNIYKAAFALQTNPQREDRKLLILISCAFSSASHCLYYSKQNNCSGNVVIYKIQPTKP